MSRVASSFVPLFFVLLAVLACGPWPTLCQVPACPTAGASVYYTGPAGGYLVPNATSAFIGVNSYLFMADRTVNSSQQVVALQFGLGWGNATGSNYAPVHVTLALYSVQTCPGSSVVNVSLVAQAAETTYPAGSLASNSYFLLTTPTLTTPVIPAGQYLVAIASNAADLLIAETTESSFGYMYAQSLAYVSPPTFPTTLTSVAEFTNQNDISGAIIACASTASLPASVCPATSSTGGGSGASSLSAACPAGASPVTTGPSNAYVTGLTGASDVTSFSGVNIYVFMSLRLVSAAQQVTGLSFGVGWAPATGSNTVAVSLAYALYYVQNCTGGTTFPLVAQTAQYTFAPGTLTSGVFQELTLPTTTTPVIPSGQYLVGIASSNGSLGIAAAPESAAGDLYGFAFSFASPPAFPSAIATLLAFSNKDDVGGVIQGCTTTASNPGLACPGTIPPSSTAAAGGGGASVTSLSSSAAAASSTRVASSSASASSSAALSSSAAAAVSSPASLASSSAASAVPSSAGVVSSSAAPQSSSAGVAPSSAAVASSAAVLSSASVSASPSSSARAASSSAAAAASTQSPSTATPSTASPAPASSSPIPSQTSSFSVPTSTTTVVQSSSGGGAAPIAPGGSSSSSGLSNGAIAGIVVGSVVGGLLLLALCLCCIIPAAMGKSKQQRAEGEGVDNSQHYQPQSRDQRSPTPLGTTGDEGVELA